MSKKLIPIVVLVVVAVIVVLLVGKKSPVTTEVPVDTTLDSENATTTVAKPVRRSVTKAPATPETAPTETVEEETPVEETSDYTPEVVVLTIMVNDTATNLNTIEARKGDEIRLTFVADPRNNYHGGLEMRSDVMDPITILNGQSKMVLFTADDSFSFTPYWPGATTPLPYKIDVDVK